MVVHVATYKEGEAEPGYWEDPNTKTHRVVHLWNPDADTDARLYVSLDLRRRENNKIQNRFKGSIPAGAELSHWRISSHLSCGSLKICCAESSASVDECLVDFAWSVREELLRRYPHLAQVPLSGADAPLPRGHECYSRQPKRGAADNR